MSQEQDTHLFLPLDMDVDLLLPLTHTHTVARTKSRIPSEFMAQNYSFDGYCTCTDPIARANAMRPQHVCKSVNGKLNRLLSAHERGKW